MKLIGRLVFKPREIFWGVERMSFKVYRNKEEYIVRIWEKNIGWKKLHFYNPIKKEYGLLDMVKIMARSEKRHGGRITVNTLPKEIMNRAKKELILHNLK